MSSSSPLPRVLLTLPIHPQAERELESFATPLRPPSAKPETLLEWAAQADAVIVRAQLPDDIFKLSPRLKVAVRHGTGVDMIPLAQAKAHGVIVANVPGVNAKSVAEYALWALIGACRKLINVTDSRRLDQAQPWQWSRAFADTGHELDGSTIGIVGYGSVGQQLATMLQALWSVRVRVYNRSPIEETPSVKACSLDELLAQSDAVVLSLPLTEETHHLIDARRLALMKQGAILINVARGAIVQEAAMLEALDAGPLGMAVLDVFTPQPLANDHPLWKHPRALVTPHVAGVCDESMLRMGFGAVDAVRRGLSGQKPHHLVTL